MTSQISKKLVLALVCLTMSIIPLQAQESQMNSLINQSLSKVEPSAPETLLQCIAELQRIDAMYPDSIAPKFQESLHCLYYSVQFPQAEQTPGLLAQANETIGKMEQMKGADLSDVNTLWGFYYMVQIVRDPSQNGPRYYLDVMQYYEKALKLNPQNELAKTLQQQFLDGMRKSME